MDDAFGRDGYAGGVAHLGGLARLARYRAALLSLALRALKVRYRRSILGFGWVLLYPAAATAVLTVVFSGVFPQIEHYVLYVSVGLLVWNFVSLSCVQAMDALLGGASVMRKVYVPSVLFPLSAVTANFANLVLSGVVVPPLVMWCGVRPVLEPLLLAFGLACLAAFTAGLALSLAAANLFFRDIRYFFEALLLVWFYATPVVYPVAVLPEPFRLLLWFNPAYWLLELLRLPLCAGTVPGVHVVAAAGIWAAVSLFVGWNVFGRLERSFHLYL